MSYLTDFVNYITYVNYIKLRIIRECYEYYLIAYYQYEIFRSIFSGSSKLAKQKKIRRQMHF